MLHAVASIIHTANVQSDGLGVDRRECAATSEGWVEGPFEFIFHRGTEIVRVHDLT